MVDTDFLTASPPVTCAESLRASIDLLREELSVLSAADVVAFDAVDLAAMAFACTERGNDLLRRAAAMRRDVRMAGRQSAAVQAEQIGRRNLAIAERLSALANGGKPVVVVVSELS